MTSWLLARFDQVDPRVRRLWAARFLIAAVALWAATRAVFLAGLLSHQALDAITNDLSWLAIAVTCGDVLLTSDVRTEQEDA